MKKIWDFFENLNELVYAADLNTYELLYMNKKTREAYGFSSAAQTAGKKCYEVMHGCGGPCTICGRQELKEGSFREIVYYSPRFHKYLKLKDTLVVEEGRQCRLEIAIDISMQGCRQDEDDSFQSLEVLANEGLRVALQAPTPDQSIEAILEYVGKTLKGARTYIFEKNRDGRDDNTYEWVADGVRSEKDTLQNLHPEVSAAWYQIFQENRNIIIEDVEDIHADFPQYQILKRQNIHSLAVVPLYDDKKIIGFYGVDNPAVKSLEFASHMLQIMGHFIISSIKRRDLVQQLQEMSYCDQLTKMGNRYAMNRYTAGMQLDAGIGVVYCDITGLKRVNDEKGHKEGDKLIVRACTCMKKAFDGYGLFRIGGDELLALCQKIEEEELEKRVEDLKIQLQESDIVMAVGYVWRKECAQGTVERLLSEAEKLMYKDKAAYYRKSGVDRRR